MMKSTVGETSDGENLNADCHHQKNTEKELDENLETDI